MNLDCIFPDDFIEEDEIAAIIRDHWLVFDYTVNKDKSIDVQGDVRFPDFASFLTVLPLKFNIVSGDFDCSALVNLTTLKGAPVEVGGTFNCAYTGVKSLEFAPKKAKQLIFDNCIESIVIASTMCIYDEVTIISRKSNAINSHIDKLIQNSEYLPIIFKYLPFFSFHDEHLFNEEGLDSLISEIKDGLR